MKMPERWAAEHLLELFGGIFAVAFLLALVGMWLRWFGRNPFVSLGLAVVAAPLLSGGIVYVLVKWPDWVRPKWMHSNKLVRLCALQRIHDETILGRVVMYDESRELRKLVLPQIVRHDILVEVAARNSDEEVAKAALERIDAPDLLADVVERATTGPGVRKRAAAKMSPSALLAIATTAQDMDVRCQLVQCLDGANSEHAAALVRIAINDPSQAVRQAALERVTRESDLASIACAGSDPLVATAALRRISSQGAISHVLESATDPSVIASATERLREQATREQERRAQVLERAKRQETIRRRWNDTWESCMSSPLSFQSWTDPDKLVDKMMDLVRSRDVETRDIADFLVHRLKDVGAAYHSREAFMIRSAFDKFPFESSTNWEFRLVVEAQKAEYQRRSEDV
jgi:hypothetical protein